MAEHHALRRHACAGQLYGKPVCACKTAALGDRTYKDETSELIKRSGRER